MINLTIKIKGDTTAYTKKEYLPDNFSVCKNNPVLQKMVETAIEASKLDCVNDVNVVARFEW